MGVLPLNLRPALEAMRLSIWREFEVDVYEFGWFSIPRGTGIAWLAFLACAGLCVLSLQLGREQPALVVLPLAVTACAAAGLVLLLACCGSPAAVMAFLFVLVFVNDALFRVREPGDLGLDWQNAMKFALWGGAGLIGLCQIGRSWDRISKGPPLLILTWLGIALLSCFYSASATYSFGTAVGAAGMFLFAAGTAIVLTEKQALLTFAIALSVFVLVGWVVYFAIPSLGRSPFITSDGSIIERMCGLAGQANALGCSLATLLACAFVLWYRGHCRLVTVAPFGLLALGTLLSTDSRTALLAFLVGAVAVMARRTLWRWGASLLAASLGFILIAAVPLRTLMSLTGGISRSGDPTEFLTLTGRTEIWAFVLDKIELQPWFGYGYNSSKFILPLFLGLPGLTVDEAHNTWLQNLLGTGIVGTAPLVGLVVLQLVLYVRAPDPFRDLMLFVMLVWGITVAGAYGSTPTVMTLMVFMSQMVPSATSRARLP